MRVHVAAPAWVLLHGAGGGPWEWLHWSRRLGAERRRAVCPDFSATASGAESITFAQLSERLGTSLQAEAGAVLIGASFGGLLAASLARPLRASALVLINPIPCASAATGPFPSEAASPTIACKHWGLNARMESTQRSVPELDPVDAATIFRRWIDFDAKLLAEARAGISLPRPDCPILMLLCSEDRELSASPSIAMAQAWGADIVRTPGSHVSPLIGKRWQRAFELVEGWLAARLS